MAENSLDILLKRYYQELDSLFPQKAEETFALFLDALNKQNFLIKSQYALQLGEYREHAINLLIINLLNQRMKKEKRWDETAMSVQAWLLIMFKNICLDLAREKKNGLNP